MQIDLLQIETCIATYNINNRKMDITGLSGQINGIKLDHTCWDLRMWPFAVLTGWRH